MGKITINTKAIGKFFSDYKFYFICFFTGAIISSVCVFFGARNITNKELTNLRSEITSFGSTISELRANNSKLEADKNGLNDTVRQYKENERQRQIAIDAVTAAAEKISIGLDSAASDIRQVREGIQGTISDLSKSLSVLQTPSGTR